MRGRAASELRAARNGASRVLLAPGAATFARLQITRGASTSVNKCFLSSLFIIAAVALSAGSVEGLQSMIARSDQSRLISSNNNSHRLAEILNHQPVRRPDRHIDQSWWQQQPFKQAHADHVPNSGNMGNQWFPRQPASSRSLQGENERPVQAHSSKPHAARSAAIRVLPNGPPPFRPSSLVLGLNSLGLLDKLKRTKLFKRMYKSKVYYLFLDVLQQLVALVDQIAKKKIHLASSNVATVQAVAGKLLLKGGQQLKLKWPLVMLNPHFIREILANPTFLVMLFHAIELAYMSTPMTFWLRPLVKLVKQASPEKEEAVWWRRKRIYEVLNGHGSSELEPSLKAIHFKQPGELPPISLSSLVNSVRQLTGRPSGPPQHNYYGQSSSSSSLPSSSSAAATADGMQAYHSQPIYSASLEGEQQPPNYFVEHLGEPYVQAQHQQPAATYSDAEGAHRAPPTSDAYMTSVQEAAFLAKQPAAASSQLEAPAVASHEPPDELQNSVDAQFAPAEFASASSEPHYLTDGGGGGGANQIMSEREFNQLEPHEKALVLRETRNSLREARLAEELIRQQSQWLESFAQRADGTLVTPAMSARA